MAAVQNVLERRERRSIFALAGIFGLRLLGLFLVLPVFSVYAHGLHGAMEHPALIGIALGAYGLTQAMFQIPFGKLSDKWGRKPICRHNYPFSNGTTRSLSAFRENSIFSWLRLQQFAFGCRAVCTDSNIISISGKTAKTAGTLKK